MSSTRYERTQGVLWRTVNGQRQAYSVLLELEIVQLVGHDLRIDDEAVLAVHPIGKIPFPDGDGYTLRYTFKARSEEYPVRVQYGRFMSV